MMYKTPHVIAEIGCNHKGDFNIAKDMIMVAKTFCNVKIVKFQKRNNRELLSEEKYNAPHPNPSNAYGETYGEHREFLEFNIDQHAQLKEFCESLDMIYATSVWDLTSAKEIASLNPVLIKIPSACNTKHDMLEWLAKNYIGEIHISTGMSTKQEIASISSLFEKNNRIKDVVIYHCVSGYPVPFEDNSLLEITNLKKQLGDRVKEIGFSGHHLGIAIDIAAYTLGANYIERHFTLDRTWKGTDHAASLEPMGLRKLVRDLENTYKSLTYKGSEILDIEVEQRKKLKEN